MTTAPVAELPRWETASIYSALDGNDYREAQLRLQTLLSRLEVLFDKHHVGRGAEIDANTKRLAANVAEVLAQVSAWTSLSSTLQSYVYCFVTTDSYNTLAARELSKIELLMTRWQVLRVRLLGWAVELQGRFKSLLTERPALASHEFFFREAAHRGQFLMSQEKEDLAASLVLDSGIALGKLQGNVTSQLKVPLERDGKTELLPITVIRNLCFDPDAAVREKAYRAELGGWESIRTTVAACLNGVKGTALTLARQRGRQSVLEEALDDNRIDRPTLDAMLGAIRESMPMFRRYLKAKASKLGQSRLNWWDLFAPLGNTHKQFNWSEARDFIVEKFGRFDADLSQYAERAFADDWIDAQPRDGKRGGAFCMEIIGRDESRILANFDGSFEQVSTLAHELGHGYHNHCQRGLDPLLRGAPMTLAETASIFCETLVAEATLENALPAEQLPILEAQLCGATQVCLDISSRFQFESAVFERRGQSELSADDFCELMLAAQSDTYAEAVDPATYHRYMWLWKPHYYAYESNFYNFPYAFGHLFALGLYAIFEREGKKFVPRYQELLRSTGQDNAAPLVKRFGIDITSPQFWRDSLRIIEGQVERFEAL